MQYNMPLAEGIWHGGGREASPRCTDDDEALQPGHDRCGVYNLAIIMPMVRSQNNQCQDLLVMVLMQCHLVS